MEKWKQDYNNLLKRYNNGIDYLQKHPNELDKWSPELFKIMNSLDDMISTYNIKENNILEGYENVY